MTNHPNRSNLSYPVAAPVFAGSDAPHEIIGQARTAAEAMAIYNTHFKGTGDTPTGAAKVTPEIRGQGPVDGWAPVFPDD